MRVAVVDEALDGAHPTSLGAIGGNDTAMHRLAVDQHGAGAAIAGVATLLHAEIGELAPKGAQALACARRLRKAFAVDRKAHGRAPTLKSSVRISSASRKVMCLRQNGLPW